MSRLRDFFFVHDRDFGEVYPQQDLILKLGRLTGRQLPVQMESFGKALWNEPALMLDATDYVTAEPV